MEQELPTLPEHLGFSWDCAARSLVLCVCFVDSCLSFSFLAIVLPVPLLFKDSDYPVGVFKLLCDI